MFVFDSFVSSQVTPLLQHHPELQEELWGLFQQFQHQSLSLATASGDLKTVPDGMRREEEEAGSPPRNMSLVSSGGTVAAWTR